MSLGTPVPNWSAPQRPPRQAMAGRYVRLEPLGPQHLGALHAANLADDAMWDYLPYGPFDSEDAYRDWAAWAIDSPDPMFFTLCPAGGQAAGVASYLRINPEAGSIELGHIALSASLQRSRASTEAFALMVAWAFEAGYRRFEWKCNALNEASCRAAERLGLSFEGIFRQATVIKGRNRDTAWFAAIDAEWPALREAYDIWLDPGNFDETGQQRQSLSALTEHILVSRR